MTDERLASFFACEAGMQALAHMAEHQLRPTDIIRIIAKVRRTVWQDRSQPSPLASSLASGPSSPPLSGSTGGSSDE